MKPIVPPIPVPTFMPTMVRRFTCILAVCCLLVPTVAAAEDGGAHYWPQWRGPLGTGVAIEANPPVEWSESKNIRWKLALPGKGHSTPVIWKDRIFITTAVPFSKPVLPAPDSAPGAHDNLPSTHSQKFMVLAINRHDGNIVWQRTVREELPHEGGHVTGSLASNSPITDGELLFAFFGSRGLYCFDMNGNLQWNTDLGDMQTLHAHGEGSSPALYGETLIINWDHEGSSFVFAFDKRTGKQRWKTARDEVTSWSTPLVVEHKGKPQVIISATKRVRSYDLGTGDVIWECGGLSRNVVASPVAADGIVYVASSYDIQAMLAIRLDGARGDITGSNQIIWSRNKYTPYVPSPLLYGEMLYFLNHNQGFITCLNAKTGKKLFSSQRIEGIDYVFASPVGGGGRVYITDRRGTTLVIKHGVTYEVLARNFLDDSFSASPAIVGRELYLRGQQNLYCIAEE